MKYSQFSKLTPLLTAVFVLAALTSLTQSKSAYAAGDCQQIGLAPEKTAYQGGERVTVTVQGGANSSNIELFWRPAYLPMQIIDNEWHQIDGTFNQTTHTFTSGQWTIPAEPQEIILMTNNHILSGGFCSGNPGYINCSQGSYWEQGRATACCQGCQKRIVVNNLPVSSSVDMRQYLNFSPGNAWDFSGENLTYSQSDSRRQFKVRIAVEAPTILCGHRSTPLRFTKDKSSGWIAPVHSYQQSNRWIGNYGVRWWTTYFDSDSKWAGREFSGALGGAFYSPIPQPDHFPGQGLGAYDSSAKNMAYAYYTSGSQHFYYPPYLLAPKFLPDDLSWSFARHDSIFTSNIYPNQTNSFCRFESQPQYANDYSHRTHAWETNYGWEQVNTPAFSGQTIRIRFLEYNAYDNPSNGIPGDRFLLREDWLFAKNIGLVMLRQKNIDRLGKNRNNCGSECANTPMPSPEIEMKLIRYYSGGKLDVSGSTNWVKPGGAWQLTFSQNYTGYLDVNFERHNPDGSINTGVSKWHWVDNGQVTDHVPANISPGRWILKFRRHLPDLDVATQKMADEQLDSSFQNNTPWSNPIEVFFTDTPPIPTVQPGDLNQDGVINGDDIKVSLSRYEGIDQNADMNQDGIVNSLDVVMIRTLMAP